MTTAAPTWKVDQEIHPHPPEEAPAMTDTLESTDREHDERDPEVAAVEIVRSPLAAPPPARSRVSVLELLIAGHGIALAALVGGTAITEIGRTIVVLALAALVIVQQRRTSGPLRTGAALMTFGLAGVMAGLVIGIHHTVVAAGSRISVAGIALIVSGLPLVAVGVRRMLRPLRSWRKLVAVPIGVVTLVAVVLPIMLAMFVTNVPDYPLGGGTPNDVGFSYEEVTVTTSDGVDLAAWYIPSSNGAAVVQLGGCCAARDDELDSAAVLARNGYGVLMLDQRGHGGSEGDGMLWGWWGEVDVAAGVDFLAARSDVFDGRIGAIGMSVGGEQVIAAAGVDHRIRAVVAEGVSARGARDEGYPTRGIDGLLIRHVDAVTKHAASLMTSADTPTQMRDAVRAMTPDQEVFVIISGRAPNEVAAAAAFSVIRPDAVHTWTIADAGHIEGLATHPQEWERRVIDFLDESL
jgi:pimeloyl-ACP methyl ester carboxylesterase